MKGNEDEWKVDIAEDWEQQQEVHMDCCKKEAKPKKLG